ncbi:MAG: ABC transporter ATP-binding protein [Mycolicibacterium hassiacum]|nr:ABC transporter ATP-binding protein [Mycolicibacterium hassiacum]
MLVVEGLRVHIETRAGTVKAVDGLSLSVGHGRTLGLVGESGCGKTMTALSIMGLLPAPAARIVDGSIRFEDRELLRLPERELDAIRGREIGMIFQDPLTSLNPSFTIGFQLVETLRRHLGLGKSAARDRAVELLTEVRIPGAHRRLDDYPHHLSGGMRQRVMIALAVACNPKLLIADEPTTALDVTIQAQILDLLEDLREQHGMAMIIITHDMGVVAEVADEVVVMYAGQVIESCGVVDVFERPEHPYTEALLGALPPLDGDDLRHARLTAIPGQPPSMRNLPSGCRFAPRCPYAGLDDDCAAVPQELREIRPGHLVRTAHPRSLRTV